MSKSSNAAVSNESPSVSNTPRMIEGAQLTAPAKGRNVVSRTNGFWDESSGIPVYGKVCFAREVEVTKGPSRGKVKRYIVLQLAASTMLAANKDRNEPARAAVKGDMVGVWITPGLQDLNRMQGATVWVKRNPESEYIDTGKGNKMKTYQVVAEGEGTKVQVLPFGSDDEAKDEASGSELPF